MKQRRQLYLVLLLIGTLLGGCAGDSSNGGTQSTPAGGKSDGLITSKADYLSSEQFYCFQISGWNPQKMSPETLAEYVSTEGALLKIHRCAPTLEQHCPSGFGEKDLVWSTAAFKMRTSGNYTNGNPKSSYKLKFTEKSARLFKMRALNLKSMWNDVSQMREALAWSLFRHIGVRSPRHTYARFCINDRYYGLYSQVEQVGKGFLATQFGDNDKGNLYKAYWLDVGPPNLEYRKGSDGDDSGRQYFSATDIDERSYQLKTNENQDDDPKHQTYDDLARFIRVINAVGLEGEQKFNSDDYRRSVEQIFDVKSFLRWAGLNVLLGAWDNYWATPGNYYLYNSGKLGDKKGFMVQPYFHWIPWDYDHSLGIDYFNAQWHNADIVDWEAGTRAYHHDQATTKLPLITNLLKNQHFLAYYLDHLEWLLDSVFNEAWFRERIGDEGSGGFWDHVRVAAYLEADGPTNAPHTGRQFTNDQLYWNGFKQHELNNDWRKILGIIHYVRMRHDSAREQLKKWRQTIPRGTSGAQFPEQPAELPSAD